LDLSNFVMSDVTSSPSLTEMLLLHLSYTLINQHAECYETEM